MHSFGYRANAVVTFAVTILAVMCGMASLSDNFNSPSPTADVKVRSRRSVLPLGPSLDRQTLTTLDPPNFRAIVPTSQPIGSLASLPVRFGSSGLVFVLPRDLSSKTMRSKRTKVMRFC